MKGRADEAEAAPRAICRRCRRPVVVCYCPHLRPVATRTRVLVLQHPDERRLGVGTARMAHLSLAGSLLRAGVDFTDDATVGAWLASEPPPYLLFPGEGAIDPRDLRRGAAGDPPLALVVLDGTWAQARSILRRNPRLGRLPRVAFAPSRPSAYAIRHQPADVCVSTLEALAEVLSLVEPEAGASERLLRPFAALVERQQWYQATVQTHRHRRLARLPRPATPPRRARVLAQLEEAWPRLVCVQGEASAWPSRAIDPRRTPPETVHFLAWRPATGERYEAVIAPRGNLAPSAHLQLELPVEQLRGGGDLAAWRASWSRLRRDGDVLVCWGRFGVDLARAEGLALDGETIDLRRELSQAHVPRLDGAARGSLEDSVAALGASPLPLGLAGRGGRRLALLAALVSALRHLDAPAGPP